MASVSKAVRTRSSDRPQTGAAAAAPFVTVVGDVRHDGHRRGVEQGGERRGVDDADVDGAGEVLANARDALGGRVGQDDADVAVAAADRSGADARELLAAHAGGGFAVDHERLVVEIGELPAARGRDRVAALVARLDALFLVERGLVLALEVVVVHCRPPGSRIYGLSASVERFFRRRAR